MTKHNIEVSEKIWNEYIRLKLEIKKIGGQEVEDDHVLAAMIGGFFDSLEYMKKANINDNDHEHGHHHDESCCKEKGDDCCGGKGKNHECDCK